jgi:hypothetical protein
MTKQPTQDDIERRSALAQFHVAEYAVMMARVQLWINLQYALWPIVFGVWFLLAQLNDVVTTSIIPWLMAATLPVGYVAYQNAMIDALKCVLLVEARLRPLATELAGTSQFWLHERERRRKQENIGYGKFWPPLVSFASPVAVLAYLISQRHSFGWIDIAGFLGSWGIAAVVLQLTFIGKQLDDDIGGATRRTSPPSSGEQADGEKGESPAQRASTD